MTNGHPRLNYILNLLIYSNILVSFFAVAITAYAIKVMDYKLDLLILSTIFFATLFGYNFQRKINLIINKDTTPSEQNLWILKHSKFSNTIIIISFIACFYFLYRLPPASIILITPLAVLSLLYVLRIGNWPALRNIPFLKVFVVAFVWGGVIVLLPAIYESHSLASIFTLKKQLLSLSLALFVFGQSLPFDIRDMDLDKEDSLRTIPHKIGISKTLKVCWISLGMAGIVSISSYLANFISIEESVSFILALISTSLILLYYRKPRKSLAYAIVLESCLILPLFYYFLIELLFT